MSSVELEIERIVARTQRQILAMNDLCPDREHAFRMRTRVMDSIQDMRRDIQREVYRALGRTGPPENGAKERGTVAGGP